MSALTLNLNFSTAICKNKHQSLIFSVKLANKNQTNNIIEYITFDFEYDNIEAKLKSLSTTICEIEHHNDKRNYFMKVICIEKCVQARRV